jgi:anhydro-N-acetylmuramic acid kinase
VGTLSKKKNDLGSRNLFVLGVMTGTSCDGLDASCLEIDPAGWRQAWSFSKAYPKELRNRVLAFQTPGCRHEIKKWLELHRDLGDWYASTLTAAIAKSSDKPEVIANHGQTLAHFPGSGNSGMTLQLGDPTRIAAMTGLTVVSQFRTGDMAVQGQGAPLVPLFHRLLASQLASEGEGVSFLNVGGIANLTYIAPETRGEPDILAFDTGPGNIWIDAAAEKASGGKLKMDKGGKLADRGNVDRKALMNLLKHPYFEKPQPKSTGRDDFPISQFFAKCQAKGADSVATATALTVESIARAYEKFVMKKNQPLSQIFVCGGGAKNPTLLEWLRLRLSGVEVEDLSEAGFESQWVESSAFALFGFLSLMGTPIGGKWTGAKGFGPPGLITPGENWPEIRRKIYAIGAS